MQDLPAAWKQFNAYLRLYVAVTPESAEQSWRQAKCFDAIRPEDRTPGHYYRFHDDDSLIEFKPDGSGQWHPADQLPDGFDPARVVDVPAFPVKSLRDELLSLLNGALENSSDCEQITEKIAIISNLSMPERAARLLAGFRGALQQVPETVAAKMQFLEQAASQMVGRELPAGKVHGRDTAGVLFISALAKQLAALNEKVCLAILAGLLKVQAGSMEELGAIMMNECWHLNLKPQVSEALSQLQSSGNGIVKQAQEGAYPDGHPEYCLEIYYGGILQAIPYLLSAQDNYFYLRNASNLTEDEQEIYAQRQEATEERTVRLNNVLLYAAQDVDQSRLRAKQVYIRSLMKTDTQKAEEATRQAIEFEFFYPRNFRSVLIGNPA